MSLLPSGWRGGVCFLSETSGQMVMLQCDEGGSMQGVVRPEIWGLSEVSWAPVNGLSEWFSAMGKGCQCEHWAVSWTVCTS